MSSLRLALKQSLQEAGGLSGDDDVSGKKKRKKLRKNMMIREKQRRSRQSSSSDQQGKKMKKRGPGRPRKHPRPDDDESEDEPKKRGPGRPKKTRPPMASNEDDDQDDAGSDGHGDNDSNGSGRGDDSDSDDGHSSSENEFSSSSGEEEDEDGEDDGSDDEQDGSDEEEEDGSGDDEDEKSESRRPSNRPSLTRSPSDRSNHSHGEEIREYRQKKGGHDMTEDELRRQKKLLKKKLKHSAANKIQNQWKKKKMGSSENDDDEEEERARKPKNSPQKLKKSGDNDSRDGDGLTKKKKKKKNNGVVPKPSLELFQWSQNMTEKKCRKYIVSGLRVKVRFAVPVKRDGQTFKKKIWYGGRVTAVSKMGSKIRIKYDDGTSEVSQFPDDDIVVDCEGNGEHSVSADRFLPPSMRPGRDELRASFATVDSAADSKAEHDDDTKEKGQEDDVKVVETSQEDKPKILDSITVSTPEKLPSTSTADTQEVFLKPPMETPTQTKSKQPDLSTPPPVTTVASAGNENPNKKRNLLSLGSPEEGELSPGMTARKNDAEDTPSPAPMDVDSGLPTKQTVAITPAVSTLREDQPDPQPHQSGVEKKSEKDRSDDKRLSISLPKSLSTKVPSPRPSPKKNKAKRAQADDALLNMSGPTEIKRKRPSETESTVEEPPRRKLKVSSPKSPRGIKGRMSASDGSKDDQKAEVADKMSSKINDSKSSSANDDRMSTETSEPVKAELLTQPSSDTVGGPLKSETNTDQLSQPSSQALEDSKEEITANALDTSDEADADGKKSTKDGKKIQRSKSPLPKRSSSPIPQPDDIKKDKEVSSATNAQAQVEEAVKGKGESTPVNPKEKKHPNLVTSKSNESFNSIVARGGRKAAMEAMEKMTSTKDKKEKTATEDQKKKKRKRKEDGEGAEDSQDWVNEMEWVQCDSCSKWRVLPSNVKVSDLPNKWYCRLNVYDPKRNTCDAPEQTAKEALKELKRAKKRAKKLEQIEADKASQQEEKEKDGEKKEAVPVVSNPAASPKPAAKVVKVLKSKQISESKTDKHPEPAPEEQKVEKKKRGKKGKILQQQQQKEQQPHHQKEQQTKEEQKKEVKQQEREVSATLTEGKPQVPEQPKKKRRGRPPRNASTSSGTSQDSRDADNVEWVQCEKCSKWRKLPAHLSADELPDVWICSMNSWNPDYASCKAPEETTDSQHSEVGTSEWQLRQTHAGKYSYRTMIFGTGAKKQNRPMSERSRAAESLFQSPDDDERPYPTCSYASSSMFSPKMSNFHKSQLVEEKTPSVFDVLSDCNMFNELRDMALKPTFLATKQNTYESLDDAKRNAMSDIILDIIGDGALTEQQVISRSIQADIGDMARYCTNDIIVNTLLSLVRHGALEFSCVDPAAPVQQWVSQFRRTKTHRAREIVQSIKSSSCLKISKPWKKQPVEQTQWITGASQQS